MLLMHGQGDYCVDSGYTGAPEGMWVSDTKFQQRVVTEAVWAAGPGGEHALEA